MSANFPPNLSDILNICKNLTMLRYVVVNPDCQVFLPITLTAQQNTSLKELILPSACKKDKMNRTELQKLLKNSPHLSRLAILNCDDSIYTAVQKHGQSINKLEVVHHNSAYNFSSIASPHTLLQLIKNYHHTISFLSINFCQNTSTSDDDWRKWTNDLHLFKLINLTEFSLTNQYRCGTLTCKYLLPAIITTLNDSKSVINQQTPNLQSLVLYGQNSIPNSVLDAIIKMPKFTKLDLYNCSFDLNKMHDVLKIFERRSNSNNTILTATTKTNSSSPPLSLLTTLCLEETNEMNDAIVLTASKIKSLTHLSIDHKEYEDDRVYKMLVQNISKLPLLERMDLHHVDMKRDHLKALTTSKSLRHIELYGLCDYFDDGEIYQLAKNASNNELEIINTIL